MSGYTRKFGYRERNNVHMRMLLENRMEIFKEERKQKIIGALSLIILALATWGFVELLGRF